jgi:hypothetical protein
MSDENEMKIKKPFWKKWWVWLIGIFLLIIVASGCGGEPTTENKQETQSTIEEVEKTQPINKTEEEDKKNQEEEKWREEVSNYSLKSADIIQITGKALGEMGEFLQAKPLPILWTEKEMIKVAAQMVTIQMSYEDAEKLQPPKEMEKIHATFLEGMQYYNDAMDNLTKGIDSSDVDLINKAANQMGEGNKSIKEATKLIEEFTKEKL